MSHHNQTSVNRPMVVWIARLLLLAWSTLLLACDGGRSSTGGPTSSTPATSVGTSSVLSSRPSSSAAAQNVSSSGSSVASSSATMILTGQVTYDLVPHNDNYLGLNYAATRISPGRGLVIELLDSNNLILATTISDNLGNYSFTVDKNKSVRVRVKAQLLRTQDRTWNFKVTDNTNGNSVYAMDGNLLVASDATAVRNLHAASGWTDSGYTLPRVAAPFAILDSVLLGIEKVVAAGGAVDFPPLELRWSVKNTSADGDLRLGEIGTSFFSGSAIYILGDANTDADEYDRHVILHEWGHYFESEFARSDNIGGSHGVEDKLDMRVAMSEGFANAFSAMMLDDPHYRDASGAQLSTGFVNNLSHKNPAERGWYSEGSVHSVLYNFYTSNDGKMARDFTSIFSVVNSEAYAQTPAMVSIYVFADALRNLLPVQATQFNTLLFEQNIETTNAFGANETNSGGYTGSLPIYKPLALNTTLTNVCSTNRFGAYNKLAVTQFLVLDITASGTYRISVQESTNNSGDSDPDIYLYQRGNLLEEAKGSQVDQESLTASLSAGTYVLELFDNRTKNESNTTEITACFDVRAERFN